MQIISAESVEDHRAVAAHFRGVQTMLDARGGKSALLNTVTGKMMITAFEM
jgi:hypothetical protein